MQNAALFRVYFCNYDILISTNGGRYPYVTTRHMAGIYFERNH